MSTPSLVSSLKIASAVGINTILQILDSTSYIWILAYIDNPGSTTVGSATLYQYEKSSGTVISTTTIRNGSYAVNMCINPAETKIYVVIWFYYEIITVDITSSTPTISTYFLPNTHNYGFIVTDGVHAWVLSPWSNLLSYVSTADISNNITTNITNITLPLTTSISNQYVMTYDTTNTCVWVATCLSTTTNELIKITAATIDGTITVTTPDVPTCLVAQPDGTCLWLGCEGTTLQVSLSTNDIIKSYTSYTSVNNCIYIDSNSKYAWITDETSFLGINISEESQSSSTPTSGTLLTGDSTYIYTCNTGTNTLYVYLKNEPICFNENTKILSLVDDKEVYVPIQDLRKGDLVKTYLHGYKKVNLIGKGSFINNVENPATTMYKLEKSEQNNLIEDLIVTGKHSILVDNIPPNTLNTHFDCNLDNVQKIDDKYLIQSSICKLFNKIEDSNKYTYYHLVLENDDDSETTRHGIWANGMLTETTYLKDFKDANLTIVE